MMKPFFVKARATLTHIMNELCQTDTLKLMLEKYRELNLKNTLKLLYRCKLEFLTRNLLVEIFLEIMKYETHASMLKDLLANLTSYRVAASQNAFLKAQAELMRQSSERVLFGIKQLRAKKQQFRQIFICK